MSSLTKNSVLSGLRVKIEDKLCHKSFESALDSEKSSNDTMAMVCRDENSNFHFTNYGMLNNTANQIANVILKIVSDEKLSPNNEESWVIGCCMKHSTNLIMTLLAIWKCGAAYVPIEVGYPRTFLSHIVEDVRPFLIICDDDYEIPDTKVRAKFMKFSQIWQLSLTESVKNIPWNETLSSHDSNPNALILYTSGSTGVRKGVKISHFTLNHRIQWQLRRYPYEENEKFCIVKTSLGFIDHVSEIWCPLMVGRTICIVPKSVVKNPEKFVPILEEFQIQRLVGVPTLLRSCLLYLNHMEGNEDKKLLKNLRWWFSSGEALTPKLVDEFFDYFDGDSNHAIINWYGATEVDGDATTFDIKSRKEVENFTDIPLGSPVDNTKVFIVDNDLNILPEGEIGEICISGVIVTSGYVLNGQINDRQNEQFIMNPFESVEPFRRMYRMGDFGMIQNGLLHYKGRRDTQIKVRGHRVDIAEVEKHLMDLPYVAKSAILVHQPAQPDQALIAFIILRNADEKRPEHSVENDLKLKLTAHMIPIIKILQDFPYLPNGKVDRQSLLAIYAEQIKPSQESNFIEIDLLGISKNQQNDAHKFLTVVGECLGHELRGKLSFKSNFFSLGGNSLNSIVTVTELKKNGFEVTITDFLKAESLGEIYNLARLESRRSAASINIAHDIKLKVEFLSKKEELECRDILAKGFFLKGDIDQYLPGLQVEHYHEFLESSWDFFIDRKLSIMVKDEFNNVVGVGLNFDAVDAPQFTINNALRPTFEFLDFVEHPVIEQLRPKEGELLQEFMHATSDKLSARENIAVMAFIEEQSEKIAKGLGFKGIFSTNTNPLTQQFSQSVYGYTTVNEVQINQYVSENGQKPFGNAPDYQKVSVSYKSI